MNRQTPTARYQGLAPASCLGLKLVLDVTCLSPGPLVEALAIHDEAKRPHRTNMAYGAFSSIFASWIARGSLCAFSHIYHISPSLTDLPGVFHMTLPSSPALRRLHYHYLKQSSPDFCSKLHDILQKRECALHEKSFVQNNLMWPIDYLDEVRRGVSLLRSPLKPDMPSRISIFPPLLPTSAYVNPEAYAVLG